MYADKPHVRRPLMAIANYANKFTNHDYAIVTGGDRLRPGSSPPATFPIRLHHVAEEHYYDHLAKQIRFTPSIHI